jgi:autotransporter-associated beta strand protein
MRISVNAETTEPINGFTPQVVFGLTDEQNHSDSVEGFGVKSAAPGGDTLPIGGSPQYFVATLDSGSQAHIITDAAAQAYQLDAAGLIGTKTQTVQGANGSEDLPITNALGFYATSFSNASVSNGAINVTPGTLQGQWDVPGLVTNPSDQLPNVIGSPILSQYRVTIQNSQPKHLTVGGTTYKTPNVSLGDFSTSLPTGYSKLTLVTSDSGPPDSPYYINFDFTGPQNPDTPGAWSSLVTNGGVALSRNGSSASGQTFMLDTGAQLSIISNDTAASVGIFNASPANADFTVDVLGVGGVQTVPGYFLNTMTLTTQGGPITWNRVPVLVLDVADPRNPSQAMPGILGTNLFGDRDLILNTNIDATGQTYLAIGPQMQWSHAGSGTWSTASNWAVVLPDGIDTQANFYGAITSAATITVDSPGHTVGSITFDNANSYTLAGPGTITMSDSLDQALVTVRTGSHTISASMSLASDTIATVIPTTSKLTISGVIGTTGGAHGVTKTGAGTLLLTGSNTYSGPTVVQNGTVELGTAARSPVLTLAGGADVQAGRLVFDYTAGADHTSLVNTIKSDLTASHASNFATGQLRDTTAATTGLTLGWVDQAATSQVIVGATLFGDTNVDGKVDVTDLGNLASAYGMTSGAIWVQGDTNYDGKVDVSDLGNLASSYGAILPTDPAALAASASSSAVSVAGVATVPEPTTLAWAGLAALTLVRRSRRR